MLSRVSVGAPLGLFWMIRSPRGSYAPVGASRHYASQIPVAPGQANKLSSMRKFGT